MIVNSGYICYYRYHYVYVILSFWVCFEMINLLVFFLSFYSLGVVNIAVTNFQELIVAADMLQLTEVVNLCFDFLK